MKQIDTDLIARSRMAFGGMAFLALAVVFCVWVGSAPAYACMDGGNYNFNENWNYNQNWNYNSNTNSNSNYNYNSNSSSNSSNSTSVTIRTTVSG